MDSNSSPAVSRVLDVDGPVHVIDFGGSGPPIVLVHGLGGSAINWLAVGPALSRRGRVLAPDLPGFGRTPPAGRSTRVGAQGEWLSRFLESVAGGPAVVVGNSMGGLIAMMAAGQTPSRVSHLVLAAAAAPSPRPQIHPAVLAAFLIYSVPWVGGWYVRTRSARLGPEGLVREMLRLCCADPARVAPELRDAHVALAAERLERMPWISSAFLDAARSTVATIRRRRRFYEMARRIAAPALLIHGARDRLVPPEASRALSAMRPDWTLELLDDVGHVAQMETPARFVDVTTRWLDVVAPVAKRAEANGGHARRGDDAAQHGGGTGASPRTPSR